ncbi:MAG: ABC transporter ATP-binding protein [Propionibacteriaceae bacterium]|nr:ABC transporter ATP-binding protein [Propionibacteriaceae bacterium]
MLLAESLEFTVRNGAVRQPILRGIDLSVEAGTMTAVMGPSGSGKSTLLNCLAGLVRPTGGRVCFEGVDLVRASARELDRLRRTEFGFVFQSYNLIEALNAEQNVLLPTLFTRLPLTRADARRALMDVDLDGLERRYPDQLSGGQRQRVAIARAMAIRRKVLFADEPTGALDTDAGVSVMKDLSCLSKTGTAVLVVTHDPVVAAYASRVIFLRDGRVVDTVTGASPRELALRIASLRGAAA